MTALTVLTPHCGLRPESPLGGEVYERRLLELLPRFGVIPIIGLPASRSLGAVPEGWEVTYVHPGRWLRWYVAPLAFVPFSVRQLRRRRVDLLRAHSGRFVAPSLFAARRLVDSGWRCPVVLHHHHKDPELAGRVDIIAARRADLVIVLSHETRLQLVQDGVDVARIAVVPAGVDLPPCSPHRSTEVGRPLSLLFMSRLIQRKNPSWAIDALAEISGRGIPARLRLIGRGPLAKALQEQADRLGVSDLVEFTPWVSEEEKASALSRADLLLFPSELEGFGLSALEAQAYGVPVIGGPARATREVVQSGRTGYMCSTRDAFLGSVTQLATNAPLRAQFAAAARDWAESFSWDESARRVAALYSTLASGSPDQREGGR